jgi:hypothetical protein
MPNNKGEADMGVSLAEEPRSITFARSPGLERRRLIFWPEGIGRLSLGEAWLRAQAGELVDGEKAMTGIKERLHRTKKTRVK